MKSDIQAQPGAHYPHRHNWVMVQTKNAFEPMQPGENKEQQVYFTNHGEPLYRMVEYAYLACTCGAVIKSRVNKREYNND